MDAVPVGREDADRECRSAGSGDDGGCGCTAPRAHPAEIEAVVAALPQVSLAAVIGRNDHKWGERPILLVEMREDHDISDQDLLASLRGRVASWWIPDAVVRVPRMPLAATGKIDKIHLRAAFGSG